MADRNTARENSDESGTEKTPQKARWPKRLLTAVLLCIVVAVSTDFGYSRYVGQSLSDWESSVERDDQGVRKGCEAYTVGKPSEVVLLMVHGINDSPHIYRKAADFLAAQGAFCRCMRLKGFGESVEDYSQATVSDWLASVDREVTSLREKGHSVCIVAHSLGAAVSIQYVDRNPQKVDGLVLAAPAIQVSSQRSPLLPVRFWHSLLRRTLWFTRVTCTPYGVDALDPQERENDFRTPFTPIRTIDNVFELIDRNAKLGSQIKLPLLMCLADQDHVIDNTAARKFFEEIGSPQKELVRFENSAHAIPVDYQWQEFATSVWKFVNEL